MSPGARANPASMDAGTLAVQFDRGIRNLVVAFVVALFVLPLVSWWAIYRTQMLSAQIASVEESRLLMSRALRNAIDEEGGLRAYLDTHEPLFLQPLRTAHPELEQLLSVLPARFEQAGFQNGLGDLARFTQLHRVWYSTVAVPLLRNPSRPDRLALLARGKGYMDGMRAYAMRIQYEGIAVARRSARATSSVIGIAVIITAIWIAAVAFFSVLLQQRAIRQQKALFDSLIHEREEVSRLSEWRARLLAMLAHDFKSQLTVLIGASHLLEDFPQRRGDTNLLASLRNASYALAEMADNAILLAHAQERRILLHKSTFDVGEVVSTVIERYGAEREFHQHRASPTAMIHADRSYAARVIDNIVANAVKYSDQPIHVYILDMPSFVKVSVVDRGIGISQDELPHIFEEFWRSERASWKRGGSGVGLFIVKTIMEAHGGRIEVESRAEKGTTVSLIFPRALSAFPSPSQPQAVAHTQNSSVANSPT